MGWGKPRCLPQVTRLLSWDGQVPIKAPEQFPIKTHRGASPVSQWLRIRLPMQGTRVRALVQEDPTCRGATKPVHHNY